MKYNLNDIKRLLKESDYHYKEDSWFFPTDLISHSTSLKYACKKLHEKGILNRLGDSSDRWGYSYKIKKEYRSDNI